jgi:hypothetical protein
VSAVRYEQVLYIPEDDILHSRRRENLKFYMSIGVLHVAWQPRSYSVLQKAARIQTP